MTTNSFLARWPRLLTWVLAGVVLLPFEAAACAVCFGDPGSAMSRGLFWGVIALLGVVMSVLGFITAFFVYIARRSARLSEGAGGVALEAGESTAKV